MGAKIFLVLWNITALAVTAIFAARARALGRRLRAIERTPTTSVATAPREGVVEIVGLVVAGPNGTFRSPLDSFDAVYMRLLLEEDESSTRRTLVDEVTAVPFYVDDGSGRALVEPDRAVVETNASGHLPEFRDRALAELVRRGKEFRPDRVLWKQFVTVPATSCTCSGGRPPVPRASSRAAIAPVRDRPSSSRPRRPTRLTSS